jgi:hypothetical protein
MRRRTFISTAGTAIGVAGLGTVSAQSERPDRERQEIRTLKRKDPDDILQTWAEGIRTLKSLPGDDPRNWDNQVRIHGNLKRFINCEHGNWLFLAWHRAYLHYHEEIIREVTGNEDFALPYWNWLDNLGFPAIFRREPFTNPSRTPNSGLDRTITGREQVTASLDDPNFLRAIGGWAKTPDRGREDVLAGAGHFESPAHDYVHIRVGGHMATGLSPNDPSFWAHHSMMDRLWWEWNARGHPNVENSNWLEWTFEDHLVDRHGDTIDVSVQDTLALPENEYTYNTRIEGGTADVPPSTQSKTASVELATLDEVVFGENVTLGVNDGLTGTVETATVEPYIDGSTEGRVNVAARDIAMPENGWFHGRVYVDPRSKDPGPGSPRYAGTYHLWIAPPAHPPQNQYVDITDTLADLYRNDELGETVEIRVVGDKMRSKGDREPYTPLQKFTLEVNQSKIGGEIVEY